MGATPAVVLQLPAPTSPSPPSFHLILAVTSSHRLGLHD